MFVVKRDTFVTLLRKDISTIGRSTILKNQKFDKKQLYRVMKCKCCEKKFFIFLDKDIPFIQIEKKDVKRNFYN
tara:strand:- start:204 stop:425 length:222 start_codon:yes stop_codon:yes gene_type:complete